VATMGWFWLSVAIIMAVIFTSLGLYDRHARRRGHQSADTARLTHERDRIRDAHAYDSPPEIMRDISWGNDSHSGGPPSG
jgi:hypothetical protein